jgi:hypothetical protein
VGDGVLGGSVNNMVGGIVRGSSGVGSSDGRTDGTALGSAEGLGIGSSVGYALDGGTEVKSASPEAAIEAKSTLEREEGATDSRRPGLCEGTAEAGATEAGASVLTTVNPPKDCSAPRSIRLAKSAAAEAGIDTVTTTLPAATLTLTKDTSRLSIAAISLAMRAIAAASKSDTEPASANVTVERKTGVDV